MADKKLLKILKKGVEVWNQWREDNNWREAPLHRDILDLSGADLSGINLSNAILTAVSLTNANLSYANLSGAYMRGAYFFGANLSNSILNDADLISVHFEYANLESASLKGSSLWGSNLEGANLSYADLTAANISGAVFDIKSIYSMPPPWPPREMLNSANLQDANLSFAVLVDVDLRKTNLLKWDEMEGKLCKTIFHGANLSSVNLSGENLQGLDFSYANLAGANLRETDFSGADLSYANLSQADLQRAKMIDTNLENAILEQCKVYGVSVWNVSLQNTKQVNLIVTPDNKPIITADNLEVAQAVYMLLEHKKIRDVISILGEKAVLLLGRFTEDRKKIIDAIANRLRDLRYLPIIFDFEPMPHRNYTETILILAGLSKFVIADITQPRSIQQEAQAIIPNFEMPFVMLVQKGEQPWSMAVDHKTKEWVMGPAFYSDKDELVENLQRIVTKAEKRNKKLIKQKVNRNIEPISIKDL